MADATEITIHLPLRFVEAISRAATIEELLTIAAQALPDLVQADRAKITLQDDGRVIARSFRGDGRHDPHDDLAPIPVDSARARVLILGTPLQLDATDIVRTREPGLQQIYDDGIRQVLYIPMRTMTTTVGVIGLARKATRGFTWKQTSMLCALADWIAAQATLMQQLRANTRLAETDALTGLANRGRLMRVLAGPGALHQADSSGRVIGVIHVDLDNFKDINDRLGHAAGDALLRHAARIMQRTVGPSDLVARTGGDEFVIATRSDKKGRLLADLASRLAASLAAPLEHDGKEFSCAASIGTALAGPDDRTAERLIGNADIALYRVKRNGRAAVCAYSREMRAEVERQRALTSEMQSATRNAIFEPYFQPVIDLATGTVAAFEILACWPHPTRGLLAPPDFLPAATEAGLVGEIDRIVRHKGLAHLQAWRAAGLSVPALSVNASADSLYEIDLPETLMWEVMGNGLSPRDLSIEVAEADLVADTNGQLERNIAQLSDLGFPVLIHDFGTGHASMPQIRRLRIAGLKLGQALAVQLPDPCAESILRAILAMSTELGLSVTAKGVETDADLARLKAMRCDRAQGFAISRPLDASAVRAFLDTRLLPRVRRAG